MNYTEKKIASIPNRYAAKNIWFTEQVDWSFAIVEQHDGYFYAYHYNGYWTDDKLWFVSYASARRSLNENFDLRSRFKKVESNLPNVHNLSKKGWLR